jgi:hypothetical protein
MSILTDVIGGVMGANAAGQAANAQVGGAQEAAQTVASAATEGNGEIRTAASNGGANVVNAGNDAGAQMLGTAAAGASDVKGTAATAATGATTASQLANVGLDPYSSAGSMAADRLKAGLTTGGDLSKTFTAADMEANDPGYQFRLQQGQQALERQAAARGGVQGGGLLKDLTEYAQGTASSEYQNAFNRFTTTQQNNVQNLQKLADAGQTAATKQGTNTTDAAQFGGALQTGAAGTAAGLLQTGAKYAGDVGIDTQKFNADLTTNAASTIAKNQNTAAEYVGNSQIYAGNARATGIIGKNNAYTGMLSGLGGGELNPILNAGAGLLGIGG